MPISLAPVPTRDSLVLDKLVFDVILRLLPHYCTIVSSRIITRGAAVNRGKLSPTEAGNPSEKSCGDIEGIGNTVSHCGTLEFKSNNDLFEESIDLRARVTRKEFKRSHSISSAFPGVVHVCTPSLTLHHAVSSEV